MLLLTKSAIPPAPSQRPAFWRDEYGQAAEPWPRGGAPVAPSFLARTTPIPVRVYGGAQEGARRLRLFSPSFTPMASLAGIARSFLARPFRQFLLRKLR